MAFRGARAVSEMVIGNEEEEVEEWMPKCFGSGRFV